MGRPFLIMVAGPNGSGKTTLTNGLRRSVDLGAYINADDLAAQFEGGSPEARARRAQEQAAKAVEEALAAGRSFTFETVMSHTSKIDLLRRARERGYFVKLFFVSTSHPAINLTRVIARVTRGGHGVPEETVRSRYERSLSYLHRAARTVDEGAIFDNSSPYDAPGFAEKPLTLVGTFTNTEGGIVWTQRVECCPDWVDRYLLSRVCRAT